MLKNYRPFLLIVVCLGLGLLVFFDNRPGDEKGAPSVRTEAHTGGALHSGDIAQKAEADSAPSDLENPLAELDKGLLAEWVERPLFAPSRKRPAVVSNDGPVVEHKTMPKRPPPAYDLVGILRDGDRAIALLRERGKGTSFRVQEGDMIGGWSVVKLEAASIVLERADGTSDTVPLLRKD